MVQKRAIRSAILCTVRNAQRRIRYERIGQVRGLLGFGLLDAAVSEWEGQTERQTERQHIAVPAELERCYAFVKRLVAENRPFLDTLTRALLQKAVLTGKGVHRLAAQCGAKNCCCGAVGMVLFII